MTDDAPVYYMWNDTTGESAQTESFEAWWRWQRNGYSTDIRHRRVAIDTVDGREVSTVHLTYAYDGLRYETIIRGTDHETRARTSRQALRNHNEACRIARELERQPGANT